MTEPAEPLLFDDEADEGDADAIAAPLEALLLMATEPVSTVELAQAVRAPVRVVERTLAGLADFYDQTQRGFELRYVAGGWRYWTRPEYAELIGEWLIEGQHAKLSQAALETLAVVAYLQPISRSRVSAVRGVNVDGVMRTPQQRGYIEEVGRDPGPGQATLFGTSREFLERLGLDRIEDLPPIADLFPSAEVMEALEQGLRADRPAPTLDLTDNPPEPPAGP